MGDWFVVDREDNINVIILTWDFKLKQYPDELMKKFKAKFCARGDMQLNENYLFETCAPVVQWTNVCLMIILENNFTIEIKAG